MCDKLVSVGRTLKHELTVYQLVLKDYRTPKRARWLLRLAIGYTLLPFDLIPDFIPVIGHLDDMILIPLLIIVAYRMIPKEVIADCRGQIADQNRGAPNRKTRVSILPSH